ncbi:MAG TPA: hypothetical protein VKA53_09105 [Thermoanaerobaculia bacterium]|nr:hypothetical protein [Thermoanaerobaculia bacterium]
MKRVRLWVLPVVLLFALPTLLLAGSQVSNTIERAVAGATGHLYSLERIDPCSGSLSIGSANGTTECGSWEWIAGDGSAPPNIQGVTAQGVLAGAMSSGQKHYVKTASPYLSIAAEDAANAIIERLDADPTLLPYSQSVEFLSALAKATGYAPYQAKAEEYYGRVMAARPTGAENVAHYMVRDSLAGWDVASQIRAALATNNDAYASEMVQALSSATWEGVPYGGTDYTELSHGSLIWALAEISGSDWHDWEKTMSWSLLASQEGDGSWQGDPQTSAYVLMGLSVAPNVPGRLTGTYGDLPQALANGAQYLLDSRDGEGVWGYQITDGTGTSEVVYPEVVGECITALSMVPTGGLKLPSLSPSGHAGAAGAPLLAPAAPMR